MMKSRRYEYIGRILGILIKEGPSSKYGISKGSSIPYPTVLRKLPGMAGVHMVKKVGEGDRGAEIYVATPKGALLAYFGGFVDTYDLFVALPTVMEYVSFSLTELPAVKDPLGFILGELPFKLSRLEELRVEEVVSILGAILVWRHEEWYHRISKRDLKQILSSDANYQTLRLLVAGSIDTLRKMGEQTKRLSEKAGEFLLEIDEAHQRA